MTTFEQKGRTGNSVIVVCTRIVYLENQAVWNPFSYIIKNVEINEL